MNITSKTKFALTACLSLPGTVWAAGAGNGSELSISSITLGGGVSSAANGSTSVGALGEITAGTMAAPNGSESIINLFEGGGGILAVAMGAATMVILIALSVALARIATRTLHGDSRI